MTFSIVAHDGLEAGGAVASHYPSVGGLVLHVDEHAAAVSQGVGSRQLGQRLMRRGRHKDAARALEGVLSDSDRRQLLVVNGWSAAGHTGDRCTRPAGHSLGLRVVAGGNLVEPCWDEMLEAFRAASGALEHRLLAALEAAQALGGDLRGQLAAALKVGNRIDLRVDVDEAPLARLRQTLDETERFERGYQALALIRKGRAREALERLGSPGKTFELELYQVLAWLELDPGTGQAMLDELGRRHPQTHQVLENGRRSGWLP